MLRCPIAVALFIGRRIRFDLQISLRRPLDRKTEKTIVLFRSLNFTVLFIVRRICLCESIRLRGLGSENWRSPKRFSSTARFAPPVPNGQLARDLHGRLSAWAASVGIRVLGL